MLVCEVLAGGREFHFRCYWFGCVSFSELHSSIWLSDDGNITNLVVCISFHRNTNVGTENWWVEKKKKGRGRKILKIIFWSAGMLWLCFLRGGAKISSNKQKYREKNSLSSTTSLQIFTLSIFQRDDNAHLPVYQITEVLTTLLASFHEAG